MTATFIIIYIVVALILIGFINFFLIKRKRKNKDKRVEQRSTIDSKRESNQSKFKASDLEQTTKSNTDPTQSNDIEDEKRKNHFDSEIDNASQSINTDSKEDRNALSHKNQEEDDASNDVLNPIDPNSTEGRVNERIKNQESNFIFGKGITRGKILAAMLFGMFIAILNQTLLNVALPKINTEFNISASTGQWLMTGFMLVNGILIPISAFLFNK